MERNKVSIIVPVYNVEKYLSNCIDSILKQTYKNIEVIIINDGSIDSSGNICDEYAKKDRRIKVIQQKNSGVSATRNIGIDIATGEYMQFVDSDDYLEYNMVERLIDAMSDKVNLVICGYKVMDRNKGNVVVNNYICPIERIYQKSEFIMDFGELFNKGYINSPCNKLYVTDMIKKINLHFNEGLNMGEDLLFNFEYMKVCEFISTINDSFYNYLNYNSDSLTTGYKKNFFENQQMLFSKIREFLLENECYTEQNKDFIEISYTDSVIGCLGNLFHVNSNITLKDRKEHIRKIIYDECVRKNITYFKRGNAQKRFIGLLIKYKLKEGLYYYFKLKTLLKNNIRPLFNVIKRINNR